MVRRGIHRPPVGGRPHAGGQGGRLRQPVHAAFARPVIGGCPAFAGDRVGAGEGGYARARCRREHRPLPFVRIAFKGLQQLPHMVRARDIRAGHGGKVRGEPSDADVLRAREKGIHRGHVRADAVALRGQGTLPGRDGRPERARHRHNETGHLPCTFARSPVA